jgi:hypothetical protein
MTEMEREMKRLQDEINGKEVVHVGKDGLRVDCILLWPPNATDVSVKPFGYTPEELLETIEGAWGPAPEGNKDHILSPQFCFTTFAVTWDNVESFRRIADIPVGGDYVYEDVTSWERPSFLKILGGDGRPLCPNV